ncbi:DUF2920 family protein, partial [Campylobacter sp. B0100352/1]|nr:DUF2920 family protein [Campylobacter sp. B0100352/1]
MLIAKIAPWYVDGVIDNSGGGLPSLRYIIGRDIQMGDAYEESPHYIINFFVKTYWTRKDLNSPYYLKDENYMIRTILNS